MTKAKEIDFPRMQAGLDDLISIDENHLDSASCSANLHNRANPQDQSLCISLSSHCLFRSNSLNFKTMDEEHIIFLILVIIS